MFPRFLNSLPLLTCCAFGQEVSLNLENPKGTTKSESVVLSSLDWLARNQEPDGHWDAQLHGGQKGDDNAATALAALCFFGMGETHLKAGPYKVNITRALDWLLARQDGEGESRGQQPNWMYNHGISTLTLAEAYALTKDPKLRQPLEKMVAIIIQAQHPKHGTWDDLPVFHPRSSVSVWQLMALSSARSAGIGIPGQPFELASKWLDSIGAGEHGGLYGHGRGNDKTNAMVACGFFSRHLLGESPDTDRMLESARHLAAHPPNIQERDFHYWYFGSLALFKSQGKEWAAWNQNLRPIWLRLQEKEGKGAGSWPPCGDNHMGDKGRVISTALATLSLEAYYRHLSMYLPQSGE